MLCLAVLIKYNKCSSCVIVTVSFGYVMSYVILKFCTRLFMCFSCVIY